MAEANITVIIKRNYEEVSAEAFRYMKEIVENKKDAILGLATGSTPIGLYKKMIEDHKNNGTSYKDIKTVNLDEYVGLGAESDQSYVYFMHDNLFDYIDINESNVNLPNGKAEDMDKECERYTALLNDMRQDVQLLGIGANGHIGFNEPGTPFDSTTNIVKLKEKTRMDNARFFDGGIDEVPTHAITMGIKNVMNAKSILLIANGENKADAIKAMLEGEVSEECPASILQTHPNVVVIIDDAAASKLTK